MQICPIRERRLSGFLLPAFAGTCFAGMTVRELRLNSCECLAFRELWNCLNLVRRRDCVFGEFGHYFGGEEFDAAEGLVDVQAGCAELAEDAVDAFGAQCLYALADDFGRAYQGQDAFFAGALAGFEAVAVAVYPVLVVVGDDAVFVGGVADAVELFVDVVFPSP